MTQVGFKSKLAAILNTEVKGSNRLSFQKLTMASSNKFDAELICSLFIVCFLLLSVTTSSPVLAQSEEDIHRMGEISKKIGELAKEFENCKGDTKCHLRISQEMEALSKQYQKLLPAAGQTLPPGQIVSHTPSCQNFFMPGWSCLPVDATVQTTMDSFDYDHYCDPPGGLPCNKRFYVGREYHYQDQSKGKGILIYTDDFKEFRLIIMGSHKATKISKTHGTSRRRVMNWAGTGYSWQEENWPKGSLEIRQPFHLSITFPPAMPGYSNVAYRGPHIWTSDRNYSRLATPRLPGVGDKVQFILTPELMDKAMRDGNFVRKFQWRWLFEPGEKSYEDSQIHLTIAMGKPVEDKPGLLVVTPTKPFKLSGPDQNCRFSPLKKTYKLTNKGQSPIAFIIKKDANWLALSKTDGLLDSQKTVSVDVKLDEKMIKAFHQGTHKAALVFQNRTSGKSTSRSVEVKVEKESQWEVNLTGYEIDEMDPYWKQTTKLRGAVRFDYVLKGTFTLVRDKECKWKYKSGSITQASAKLSDLHEPATSWEIKPLRCKGCDTFSQLQAKSLHGYVRGNDVHLSWGLIKPRVKVLARVAIPCTPMPDCSEWKNREFVSETFLDRVNHLALPLVDGKVVSGKVVSPQGSRWIQYRYSLKKK